MLTPKQEFQVKQIIISAYAKKYPHVNYLVVKGRNIKIRILSKYSCIFVDTLHVDGEIVKIYHEGGKTRYHLFRKYIEQYKDFKPLSDGFLFQYYNKCLLSHEHTNPIKRFLL